MRERMFPVGYFRKGRYFTRIKFSSDKAQAIGISSKNLTTHLQDGLLQSYCNCRVKHEYLSFTY